MEDLQSLLEKINRDGVEKAEAEAARIVAEAKAKAEAIVKTAREEAAKAKAEAEKAAADYVERGKVTLGQAARDTVIHVGDSVTKMLEGLLVKDVDKALGDEAAALRLVAEVVAGFAVKGEIAANAKLAAALKAQLARLNGFTVVTDETLGSGFTVKVDGGRVEHSFTGDTVAAELAKRLRPDLAALLKSGK